MANIMLPTAIMTQPPAMIALAKQDAWISGLIVTIFGLLVVLLTASLSARFPGKTFVNIIEEVLGKPGRWILGGLYTFHLLYITSIIVLETTNIIITLLLPRTPQSIVLAPLLLVVLYGVRSGIEVISRASTVAVLILIGVVGFVMSLSFQDLDARNLLPVLENGPVPVLQGAFPPLAFFTDAFLAAIVVFPFLNQQRSMVSVGLFGFGAVGAVLCVTLGIIIMNFGPMAGNATFPFFAVAREIQIAEFLARLHSTVIAGWFLSIGVMIMIWFYASAFTGAQWLGIRDYRLVTAPFAIIVAGLTFLIMPDVAEFQQFFLTTETPYTMVLHVIVPLVILVLAFAKQEWDIKRV